MALSPQQQITNPTPLPPDALNPLSSNGKQALSDLFTRHREFNILQTAEQANDVLDLLDNQFYDVLETCNDEHLGFLKAYLEGKLLVLADLRDTPNYRNVKNILSYFDKLPTIDDQKKCLEISASLLLEKQPKVTTSELLNLGQSQTLALPQVTERPGSVRSSRPLSRAKSSLASFRSSLLNKEGSAALNAYETTYDRHYSRPPTAMSVIQTKGPIISTQKDMSDLRKHYDTTYGSEYFDKDNPRTQPIRSGSGSGNRRNNPHPLKSFMVYQLPRSQPLGLMVPKMSTFTDLRMESAIKNKTSSTYFNQYLGLPQGVNIKSAFENADREEEEAARLRRSHSIHQTTTGRTHVHAKTPDNLELLSKTRHGCNAELTRCADSIIPAANGRLVYPGRGKRTTYDNEFTARKIVRPIPPRHPPWPAKKGDPIYGEVPVELEHKPFVINRNEVAKKAKEKTPESLVY